MKSKPILACALALALLLTLLTLPVLQAQEREGAPEASAATGSSLTVEALLAMQPEARRAALRAATPEVRRELWFDLKRTQATQRGQAPAALDTLSTYRQQRLGSTGDSAATLEPPARLVGSIVYDDGVGPTTFGGGSIIGNRFSSAVGNPLLASGTISTVIAVVSQGPAFSSTSAGFVIEGPQTVGGGAMAIFSTFTTGMTANPTTVTFSGLGVNYPGSSFFVLFGDFASVYVPVFGTGTTQSQGHHGVVGYTGGMGPNITSTFDFGDALNSLVRVRGNVLPVELLSFEVDGEDGAGSKE